MNDARLASQDVSDVLVGPKVNASRRKILSEMRHEATGNSESRAVLTTYPECARHYRSIPLFKLRLRKGE